MSLFYKALLVLAFLLATSAHQAHNNHEATCSHDNIEFNPGFLDVDEIAIPNEDDNTESENNGRILASGYPNIRIYPYYQFLSSSPNSYWSYVQYELVPPVISYFEAALKVKYPVAGALKIPTVQKTVCDKKTPSVLHTTGVAADYFIMFDASYDGSGSWVGDSTFCFLSTTSYRPLVVQVNLNRATLLESKGDVLLHEKNTYLLMHEVIHVLGFSSALYPYFVDSNGARRQGHIKRGTVDNMQVVVVDVPPLTNKLRAFFGCSSLSGAYMENTGSAATAGSHFERRQFVYEVMSSGLVYQQRVSQFTLGMLEGSGWYVPDYNYAEPYFFGQGQGCGFLFNSCNSKGFNFEEFCSKSANRGCTTQGRSGGYCGSDIRSDNCKYIQPSLNYDCENSLAVQHARLPNIQTYGRGLGSKCFSGTLSTKQADAQTSFCFKYACGGSGTGTFVNVQIGSKTVTCKREGPMQIAGYEGTINCPDPLSFCQTAGKNFCPRNCMGRGSCQNNKCVCYKGFKGTDCGLKV